MTAHQRRLATRPFLFTALAALLIPSCLPGQARDAAREAALGEARQIAAELTDRLRGLLGREMAQGGLGGAVRVCSEVALKSTSEFSAQKGRYVRRVSLRNRNPENAPDENERRMLERFVQQQRDGSLAAEYSEVVTQEGRDTLVYFKPVLMGPVCLSCHGPAESIPAEVRKILAERYPKDTATGYTNGEVRGAIAVKVPLARTPARSARQPGE